MTLCRFVRPLVLASGHQHAFRSVGGYELQARKSKNNLHCPTNKPQHKDRTHAKSTCFFEFFKDLLKPTVKAAIDQLHLGAPSGPIVNDLCEFPDLIVFST